MWAEADLLPDGDSRAVIAEIRRGVNRSPVVIVSRRDDWDSYLAALAVGGFRLCGIAIQAR